MQKLEGKGVAGGATWEVVENKGVNLQCRNVGKGCWLEGCDPHTPAVFVRVANKGLAAYVKWKSAEALENKGEISEQITRRNKTAGREFWL
jgi:hypothetical protein